MLELNDLAVSFQNQDILKNVNIKILKGQVHLLVGKSKSGKSTLTHYLAGYSTLKRTAGKSIYNKKILDKIPSQKRFYSGIFPVFQYTPELDCICLDDIVHNYICSTAQDPDLVYEKLDSILEKLDLKKNIIYNPIGLKFLGLDEIKRLEFAQILLFEPNLVIIDQIEDNLDKEFSSMFIDIISGIRKRKKSALIMTNDQFLLDNIDADYLHILNDGTTSSFTNKKDFLKGVKDDH